MKVLVQSESTLTQQLLLSIAEQIKLPLLQISRQAELAAMGLDPDYEQVRILAENGMHLIDGYSLGVKLTNRHDFELTPEAVSVPAILYDAKTQLSSFANLYNIDLELSTGGRIGPVLAHRQGLQSAIIALTSALIEALPAQADGSQKMLQLATHKCRYGVVAGVYGNFPSLSNDVLRTGRKLYGISRQPLVTISHTSGSGIFVADEIFRVMNLKLRVSRHHRLYGLGVVLQPSSQLALI